MNITEDEDEDFERRKKALNDLELVSCIIIAQREDVMDAVDEKEFFDAKQQRLNNQID